MDPEPGEYILLPRSRSLMLEILLTSQKWGFEKEILQSVYRGSVKFIWILLKSGGFLFYLQTSWFLRSGLLFPSCSPLVDSDPARTNREDNKKLVITWQGSMLSCRIKKNHFFLKINFTEPLYTLCIFWLSWSHICATGVDVFAEA